MIDVEKVIGSIPNFERFCSVDKLNSLVEELMADGRFTITKRGSSYQGEPIYHVVFGEGKVKVLVVAGPHADEPIGSVTVFSLLTLLNNNNQELVKQDIQWHIVPCIDPDGAKLNEGWTQEAFSHKSFMENFHKQDHLDQVDASFPIKFKEFNFDKPTQEARVLMGILEELRPDYYFSLHNAFAGGGYFYISEDVGEATYHDLYALLKNNGIPLNTSITLTWGEYAEGVYPISSTRRAYESYDQQGLDVSEYPYQIGESSWGYLQEINPGGAVSFQSELAYANHPYLSSGESTSVDLRKVMLDVDANNKYVKTVVLEEWEKVKDHLNKDSPFYNKVYAAIVEAGKTLNEYVPEMPFLEYGRILSDPNYARKATLCDLFKAYMLQYWMICHNYEFVRLLESSTINALTESSITRLKNLFNEVYEDVDRHIKFSLFEIIDINVLARVQFGSGLIVLNGVLLKNQ